MRVRLVFAGVALLFGAAAAGQDTPPAELPGLLRQVRQTQSQLLADLRGVLVARRSGAEDQQLLDGLGALVAQEQRIHDAAVELGRATLGRALEALTDAQRAELAALGDEQSGAGDRYRIWHEALRGRDDLARQPSGARILRLLEDEAVGRAMADAAADLAGNHLPQAVRSLRHALEQLAAAHEMLRNALGAGDDALARNLERLKQLLVEQQQLLADVRAVEVALAGPDETLSFRQTRIQRPAEALAEWLAGRVPAGAMPLREALTRMEFSAAGLQHEQYAEAVVAMVETCGFLEAAIAAVEEAIQESLRALPETDVIPLPMRRKENLQRAMRMMLAGGAGGNPLVEVLNDLNAIDDLAKEQNGLREQTQAVAEPQALTDEQSALAVRATALARRVGMFEPEGEDALAAAAGQMNDAAAALGGEDRAAAVAAQESALASLARAHAAVKAFWDALLEAMAALMTSQEGGMAMGGAEEEDRKPLDERTRRELLAMLKAVITMNEIAKTQTALAERVAAATGEVSTEDPEQVADEQVALALRLWELSRAQDLDPHLANQLRGVWDYAMAAAIQARIAHWPSTLAHQRDVLEGLRLNTSALSDVIGKLSRNAPLDEEAAQMRAAAAGARGMFGAERGEAWLIDLPPREREVIRQALSEPYPAEFDALIRAYFGRLAREHEANHDAP